MGHILIYVIQIGICSFFFVSDTSRAPRNKEVDGQGYYFTDRETMERDILENKYVEYGEFNGNLYGTRVDSCWDVVKQGKMCVLDVSPLVSEHSDVH